MIRKLLFIDYAHELEEIRSFFEKQELDFETDFCFSVGEAARLFQQDQYGLIIMNIKLLDQSIIGFLEAIRQSNFFGQFALTADYKDQTDRAKMDTFSDLNIILKPLDKAWLLKTLTGYFSNKIDLPPEN